jgi:predicted dehydrogenase
MKASKRTKVKYAVIGLGHISQAAVLPAFEHAKKNSELAALVSGDATKRKKLSKRYGVPAHDYSDLEDLLAAGEIDAVYIGLPNHLHAEYAIRAARQGVHVLCEKPLAVTSKDCRAMIDAAARNDVKLMTAYRLHFEKANLELIDEVRRGKIGEVRAFSSDFALQVKSGNIRTDAEKGGGPLLDLGVYCINAARYVFGAEPTDVFGVEMRGDEPRFAEIPESVSATLRFPGERVASFHCSFGASSVSTYRVIGTKGHIRLEPAYSYRRGLTRTITREERSWTKEYEASDQFAPELLYFSECVLEDRVPEPSGFEGLIDVRIAEAIVESIRLGKRVALPPMKRSDRPDLDQEIRRPKVAKRKLVKAASASR